jgi:hypothetical protein
MALDGNRNSTAPISIIWNGIEKGSAVEVSFFVWFVYGSQCAALSLNSGFWNYLLLFLFFIVCTLIIYDIYRYIPLLVSRNAIQLNSHTNKNQKMLLLEPFNINMLVMIIETILESLLTNIFISFLRFMLHLCTKLLMYFAYILKQS